MQRFGAFVPGVVQATVNPQASAAKSPPRAPFAAHRHPPSPEEAAVEDLALAPVRLEAEEKESEEPRRNIDTLI